MPSIDDHDLLNEIPFITNNLMDLDENSMTEIEECTEYMVSRAVQYKELRMYYGCAIKQVRTKLEVLNAEFTIRYQRNPINFINYRLKNTASIVMKLRKQNVAFSIENIEEYLSDVAGVRVICSFVDDIYKIADALTRQDDVTLIEKKDYIAKPKSSGYRSLHLIVAVPVYFSDQTRLIKVEVQIRTIAMDFWASLEHQLKYKKKVSNEEEIIAELKECADIIGKTDARMLDIRNKISKTNQESTRTERILEGLEKFDTPINC